MRAVLAGNKTAGQNINLVIAQMVIYNVGFSGLLYSSYTLVLDRSVFLPLGNGRLTITLELSDKLTNPEGHEGQGVFSFFKRLLRNLMLFRLALTAAIVIGIIGGVSLLHRPAHSGFQLNHSIGQTIPI